ncbi:protein SMG7-like [Agrilus planipennis]|uniref:Protein SMG7-like n=1 Tax=Agrilus planipennis TaxID=224129 RepID=A0A1W4WC78_AGRPL|nr:protein SMG7-like [Agrilus planipennis]
MKCKAAIQALQKADALKASMSQKHDLINDSKPWNDQQQLRTIYHEVLILDLEYALDKKIEQELWMLGFKNYINTLQEIIRDVKNPQRSDAQALLSWCLQTAFGFYSSLLQEFCALYDLDMPFHKLLMMYEQTRPNTSKDFNKAKNSSCLYMCQYCLVHLGDIARYQNHRKQAESYYKYSIQISPTSGQPYNQLALLETSHGDKLATVYYYIRSIAVKNPFHAATANLLKTLSTVVEKEQSLSEVQTKMSVNEFIQKFLKAQGLLLFATDLEQVEIIVKSINATLTALIATQSFTMEQLLRMVVINLYQLKNLQKLENEKNRDVNELTEDEKKIRNFVLELLAGSLSAFLLPVYTLKHDKTLLDYYALPALTLILYWIKIEPEVLQETVFTNWPQIWPSLCKLLNSLQEITAEFDCKPYENVLLYEDRELQGFLPFSEIFKKYKSKVDKEDYVDKEKTIRAKRLIEYGTWLTSVEVNSKKLINNKKGSDEDSIVFEPQCTQPDPTSKLLEEMKSFSLSEVNNDNNKSKEKRSGILKPQGSLEKAREEREQLLLASETGAVSHASSSSSVSSISANSNLKVDSFKQKRVRQNVALQSIFKKIEESKQVKFSVEPEKEKIESIPKKQTSTDSSVPPQNEMFWTSIKGLNEKPVDYPKSSYQYFPNTSFDIKMPMSSFVTDSGMKPMQNFGNYSETMHGSGSFSLPPQTLSNSSQSLPPLNNSNFNSSNFPNNFGSNNPNLVGFGSSSHNFNTNMPPSYRQQGNYPPNNPNIPYQNISHYPQFSSTWKTDSQQVPPWSNWPNSGGNQPSQNQQDNYQLNYQYQGNMPYSFSNIAPNNMQKKQDTSFNSPWNPMPPSRPVNYDGSNMGNNQSLSLRQAMLKEAKNVAGMQMPPPPPPKTGPPEEKMYTPPGYSLFNSGGWSPNLSGQFRNTVPPDMLMNQHSLFAGQAPQSLQQLLEQQNKFKNNS